MTIFSSLKLRSKRVKLPGSWSGITIYPFVFSSTKVTSTAALTETLAHEFVHWNQQDKWWRIAGPLGLLAWFFLYVFVLPVGWNYWRWKWEFEAYHKTNPQYDLVTKQVLRQSYKLWFMS